MEKNNYEDTEQEGINNGNDNLAPEEENTELLEDVKENDEAAEKLAECQDRYLRLSAEFDNYRKRTLKERIELIKTAGEDIIKDLLPVLDDFDRAIEVMNTSANVDAIAEGTKLIHNKLNSILENKGLKAMYPVGEDFDADIHEAVAKVPAEGQSGKIIDVVQKGYSLNDKIIRHPKVVVGE